jgi:hypothetical protein
MQSKKMDYSSATLLTPHNYFEWTLKILHQLRCRGFKYRITMATEVEPTSAIEKNRYLNRKDEAYGLLGVTIPRVFVSH